jgi:hypothetical protein
VRPADDVDRVELEEPDVADGSSEMATIDSAARPGTIESLGCECHTLRLIVGELGSFHI